MMHAAVHTDSKVWGSEASKQRVIQSILPAAVGVNRLLPILWRGKIIGWLGGESWPSTRVVWIEHRSWMNRWIDSRGYWCGFTTIDDLIAECTKNNKLNAFLYSKAIGFTAGTFAWSHLFPIQGLPAPGSLNGTARTAVPHDDTEIGAMAHGGNVSGDTKHLLSASVRTDGTGQTPICFVLYDLVLSYDNCTQSSSSQTMTNTLPAARYISTGEPGMSLMGCVTDTNTATTWSVVTYTDNDGNGSQTVPDVAELSTPDRFATPDFERIWDSCVAISPNGGSVRQLLCFPLRAGDKGVRSITNYQHLASNAGEFAFLLGHLLAWMPYGGGGVPQTYDFVRQIPSVPRIVDGACLTFAIWHGNPNPSQFSAFLQVAWG